MAGVWSWQGRFVCHKPVGFKGEWFELFAWPRGGVCSRCWGRRSSRTEKMLRRGRCGTHPAMARPCPCRCRPVEIRGRGPLVSPRGGIRVAPQVRGKGVEGGDVRVHHADAAVVGAPPCHERSRQLRPPHSAWVCRQASPRPRVLSPLEDEE
jgi:hypothetical protein